jgi:hypothetical protein
MPADANQNLKQLVAAVHQLRREERIISEQHRRLVIELQDALVRLKSGSSTSCKFIPTLSRRLPSVQFFHPKQSLKAEAICSSGVLGRKPEL